MKTLKQYLKISFIIHIIIGLVFMLATMLGNKKIPSITIKGGQTRSQFNAYFKNNKSSTDKNKTKSNSRKSKKAVQHKKSPEKVGTKKSKKELAKEQKQPAKKTAPIKEPKAEKVSTEQEAGTSVHVGKKEQTLKKKNKSDEKKKKKKKQAEQKPEKKEPEPTEKKHEPEQQEIESPEPTAEQEAPQEPILPPTDETGTELVETDVADDINLFGDYDDGLLLVYQRHIRDEITRLWRPPLGVARGATCTVRFVVDNKGDVVEHEFISRSKILIYDLSISKIINKLAFHKSLWGKEFTVDFKQ